LRTIPRWDRLVHHRSQGDDFVWRGNEMQVERLRPRGMMARMTAPAFMSVYQALPSAATASPSGS
jgi:hypothetical protein